MVKTPSGYGFNDIAVLSLCEGQPKDELGSMWIQQVFYDWNRSTRYSLLVQTNPINTCE